MAYTQILKNRLKALAAKFVQTLQVQYGSLTIIGPFEDRGFLRALARNEREPLMAQTLLEQLQPGSIFLDVGAHLGQYSLLAAQKLRMLGSGHVYAFEPHPRSSRYLQQNIEQNNLNQLITLERLCAAQENGSIEFFADALQSDYSSTVKGAAGSRQLQSFQVQAVALDEYFAHRPLPTVIKIDVEGAELSALQGMQDLLQKQKPILFIESNADALTRAGTSSEILFKWLKRWYAHIQIIDEEHRQLVEATPANLAHACVNLLCR